MGISDVTPRSLARHGSSWEPRGVTITFPEGFFDRSDESDDRWFYDPVRLVTHIDDGAIAAVGALYDELALGPAVLDLCSSWVSHFVTPPPTLVALGMNRRELDANPAATDRVVQDLNAEPTLPFPDGAFDDATCCVSVDYLTRPVEVFAEVARVLRPGGRFVCTWSNRCFPTKAVRGWLATPEERRSDIVAAYFAASGAWGEAVRRTAVPADRGRDPLWAVWAATQD
jgi:SAM-dependent methyltransferase